MLEPLRLVASLVEVEGLALQPDRLAGTLSRALGGCAVLHYDRPGRLVAAAAEGTPLALSGPAPPAWPQVLSELAWPIDHPLPDRVALTLARAVAPITGPEAAALTGVTASAIIPVVGSGRRMGTMVLLRPDQEFEPGHLAAAQAAAMAAGLVFTAARNAEEEGATRARQMARSAVGSLSYSEAVAVRYLLEGLQGDEGLLVASRIADRAGITRSVLVNALRKLASASVIESRSLGKRGTYLRIVNRELRAELSRHRFPRLGGRHGA